MKSIGLFLLFGLGSIACVAGETGTATNADDLGTVSFTDLSFAHYHSQADIHAFMASEAQKHPDLVKFQTMGVSRQNREIAYMVVSNHDPATMPAIYLNGTHHGDEWSSTESILGLADYLIAHHAEPQVAAILDNYAVYLQPLVNPDGHNAKTREDSHGVDPNRDYAYPGGGAAFKVPEIALVRDLVDRIKPHGAAAYHSGIEEVLWPWCYTQNTPTDDALLSGAGKSTAAAMGFDRYLQSYDDYATTGEFIDYTYSKYNTLSLTFEVSTAKTPAEAELEGVVKNSIRGALAFMAAVKAMDGGSVLPANERKPDEGRGAFGKSGKRTTPRLE